MGRGLAGLLVAVAAAVLTLAGCSGNRNAVDQGADRGVGYVSGDDRSFVAVDKRKPAPALGNLATLEGQPYDLAAQRGRLVVLNFWGSWCPPCRAEAPALERVWSDSRAAGLQFLGVNIRDTPANALAFQRNVGVTYPSIDDQRGSVAARFPALPPNAIPSTLVIDRQGRLAARFLGPVTAAQLQAMVDRITAEPA